MKYIASLSSGKGTENGRIQSGSRMQAISVIRTIAENERRIFGTCQWWVNDSRNGKCVAAGGMDAYGKRYRIKDAESLSRLDNNEY